jgi:hypothetical protein
MVDRSKALTDEIAVYLGRTPAKRYQTHSCLRRSIAVHGSLFLWYGVRVSERLVVMTTNLGDM